ncbi:MAG: Na/Pi symporter [Candidatus Omnitrophica bacterium]|nr:Na/Pi symporter [Candidatus Omnitrophota bacterium]
MKKLTERITRVFLVLILLYIFLVSISLMSHSFECFGKVFSERLIQTTSNPIIGLFIGLLATSIIQSSSTTTSMVVGFVAGGALSIRCAIPIVMGANIGTTVTNTMVALGHITRKEEFKRAFASSTMHDLFNILTVIIIFPIEMTTRFLERTAIFIASFLEHSGGFKITSPVKLIVKPIINFIDSIFVRFFNMPLNLAGSFMLALSFILLILSLLALVKIMKKLVAQKAEVIFDKILSRSGLIALSMGCLFTAVVQSSSVTTSILVPLVGSGVLRIATAYPIVLGANIGTTITAILASLTGNIAGITIAIVHLLFNTCGLLIFYPFKTIRKIPISLAKGLAGIVSERKIFAFVYVGTIFFILPVILIYIYNLLK